MTAKELRMRRALKECQSTLEEIAEACTVKVTGTADNVADLTQNLAISLDKAQSALREIKAAL